MSLSPNSAFDDPLIVPKLLISEYDLFGLRESIHATKRFFAAPNWEESRIVLLPTFDTHDDGELDAAIRAGAFIAAHPSMSPKNAPWGDPRIKKGNGLRIVDASVMVRLATYVLALLLIIIMYLAFHHM